jgi:hypothetical protein
MSKPKYYQYQTLAEAIANLPDLEPAFRREGAEDRPLVTSARFGNLLLRRDGAGTAKSNVTAIETFFGKCEEGKEPRTTGILIGHSGQIQALLSLLSIAHTNSHEARPQTFAKRILEHSGQYQGANASKLKYHTKLLAALLNDAQTRDIGSGEERVAFDASEGSDHLNFRQYVAGVCARCTDQDRVVDANSKATYQGKIDRVFDKGHDHARDCAHDLVKVLGLQGHLSNQAWEDAPSQPSLHWLEPSLHEYLRTRSDQEDCQRDGDDHGTVDAEINDSVVSMENALRNDPATRSGNRFVILRGPEEAGKKSVIGDFLFQHGNLDTPSKTAVLRDVRVSPRTRVELPILAISLRTRNYRSLAIHVLAFLQQRSEHRQGDVIVPADREQRRPSFDGRVKQLERDHPEHRGLPPLLDAIRMLHQDLPSLFIFIDAEDLAHGSMSRMLHHRGIFRLLKALETSNDQSRFVVTATEMGEAQWEPLPIPKYIDVKMPKLDRFRWYPTGGPRSVSAFRPEQDPDLFSFANYRVPGDILAVWSLLFEAGMPLNDLKDRIVSWLKPHEDLEDAADQPRSHAIFSGLSDAVYSDFVTFLEEKDCLIEAALIAAVVYTEDGIREETLAHLSERLREKFNKNKKHNAHTLRALAKHAQSMVLRHIDNVPFDEEERGVLEAAETTANVTHGWSMSRSVALGLQRAMLQNSKQADIVRCAHRAISRAARRLSQTKRMRKVQFHRDAKWSEIARDVQCFLSLLASVPPEVTGALDEEPHDDKVRLKVDKVFSVEADFDPRRAIRFAYFCLLREDLDEQFQLSMRLDLDELRLRLYLALLHSPGELHTWTTTDLRDKDRFASKVQPPAPYPGALTEQGVSIDVAELLLTVSLAAYHCQTPWVISWTCKHFPSIEDLQAAADQLADRSSDEACTLFSRFLANAIDASLLVGEPIEDIPQPEQVDESQGSLTKNLAGVRRCLAHHLQSTPVQQLGEDSGSSQRKLAWLRLKAREAELAWFNDDNPVVGRELYQAVVQEEFKCGRSYSAQSSVVTSGRSGRRYLKVLSNDFPIYRLPPSTQGSDLGHGLSPADIAHTTEEFKYVIETNLGRLNVYGGADRIGVLLDQARKHCLELESADPDESLRHALADLAEVERHLASAPISAGSLFEVKTLSASVVLLKCELTENLCTEDLDKANEQINSAKRIAERLNMDIGKMVCHLLQARVFYSRAEMKNGIKEKKAILSASVRGVR